MSSTVPFSSTDSLVTSGLRTSTSAIGASGSRIAVNSAIRSRLLLACANNSLNTTSCLGSRVERFMVPG